MSKSSAIIIIGILVAIMPLPFFGFPLAVKEIFYIAAGIIIATIGYFSKVQYCSNCKRIIENGHYGAGHSSPQTPSGEKRQAVKKDIGDISPPELT